MSNLNRNMAKNAAGFSLPLKTEIKHPRIDGIYGI